MAYYAIIEHMDKDERRKLDDSLVGPAGPARPRSKGTEQLMGFMRTMRPARAVS